MSWRSHSADDDDGESAGESFEIAAAFRSAPGGAAAYFEEAQAGVIRSLVSQIAELVSADAEAETGPAGDLGAAGGRTAAGPPGTPGGLGPVGSTESADLEAQLGLSSHEELPDDPVLARLLPDGYSDDPEASAEFRRYTEESLRAAKVASARAVLASLPPGGGEVRLSEPECQQWLRALNDVRLALSVRLGITDENEDLSERLTPEDPRSAYVWVYQWLAYLQDSLIESLT